MAFIVAALVWVGVTVLQALLKPKARRPDRPKPDSLGNYQLPTAEEGRAIPMIWGRVKLRGPNVLGLIETASAAITGGYQYFMGVFYGFCMGRVEVGSNDTPQFQGAAEQISFNETPVPEASIVVDATNDGIRFHTPPTTATIAHGTYRRLDDVAAAAEAAMIAAVPGAWKVAHGFTITFDRTDILVYALTVLGVSTNVFVRLRSGFYTGTELADEVARCLNAAEAVFPGGARGSFTCTYSSGSSLFTIQFTVGATTVGYTAFTLKNATVDPGSGGPSSYGRTALATLGFRMDTDHSFSGSPAPLTSDYTVKQRRTVFAFGGTTETLRLSDGLFNSRIMFGMNSVDATIGSEMATSDTELAGDTRYACYGDASTLIGLGGAPLEHIQHEINTLTLFGTEGGVRGTFDFYFGVGSDIELPNTYMQKVLGVSLPAYGLLCKMIARKAYIGNSPLPKAVSIEVSRYPNNVGLGGGPGGVMKAKIGDDANPVEILYDIFTNISTGLALSSGNFILSDFQAAGQTLWTEGLGLSMQLEDIEEAEVFVREVLRHIDAALYVDPLSGLIGLVLARADYSVGSLPLIDNTNCDECSIERASWDETHNILKIRYPDRSRGYKERVIQFQNLASIQAIGPSPDEVALPGCMTETTATLVASRLLRTISYPMAKVKLKVNRDLWALHGGSMFRLTRTELGIVDMPCRVTSLSPGTLQDSRIEVDAVEDVWGMQ